MANGNPLSRVGQQQQGYAQMAQQESQFGRAQMQRGMMHGASLAHDYPLQQERVQRAQLENAEAERKARVFDERFMMKQKELQLRQQMAQTQTIEATAREAREQALRRMYDLPPLGGAARPEIAKPETDTVFIQDGKYMGFNPTGQGNTADLVELSEDDPRVQAFIRKGAGTPRSATPGEQVSLLGKLTDILQDPKSAARLRSQSPELYDQLQELQGQVLGGIPGAFGLEQESAPATGGAQRQGSVAPPLIGVGAQQMTMRRSLERAAKATGRPPREVQDEVNTWMQRQLQKHPDADPAELMEYALLQITEAARREKVR